MLELRVAGRGVLLDGLAAAEYGRHCLIFEGPGQWSALKNNPGLVLSDMKGLRVR